MEARETSLPGMGRAYSRRGSSESVVKVVGEELLLLVVLLMGHCLRRLRRSHTAASLLPLERGAPIKSVHMAFLVHRPTAPFPPDPPVPRPPPPLLPSHRSSLSMLACVMTAGHVRIDSVAPRFSQRLHGRCTEFMSVRPALVPPFTSKQIMEPCMPLSCWASASAFWGKLARPG